MILPDVNVLVYAHRVDAPDHARYRRWLEGLIDGDDGLALAETALTGFVRIVSNPRVYAEPATTSQACAFVETLWDSPRSRALHATSATWKVFAELAAGDPQIRANLVPDAWLAALAISHGARLATADRGFARFARLQLVNPLASQ